MIKHRLIFSAEKIHFAPYYRSKSKAYTNKVEEARAKFIIKEDLIGYPLLTLGKLKGKNVPKMKNQMKSFATLVTINIVKPTII